MSKEITVLAYTIADAVRASGIGRSRMYTLIAEGAIRAIKSGNRTLIPADGLQRYLASLPAAQIGREAA